jgi:hypothetical protein
MAIKSIFPALICDFNSGATLEIRVSCKTTFFNVMNLGSESANILWRIGRIDDNRLL